MRGLLSIVIITAAGAVSLAPTLALANPVTWTLEDFVFADGGTATGSFVFDADTGPTGAFSNINITTSVDGPFGTTYQVRGEALPDLLDFFPQIPANDNFTGSTRFFAFLASSM